MPDRGEILCRVAWRGETRRTPSGRRLFSAATLSTAVGSQHKHFMLMPHCSKCLTATACAPKPQNPKTPNGVNIPVTALNIYKFVIKKLNI